MGIDADTQIKEEANAISFGVKPCDKKQALEAIREALSLYLSLPNAPSDISWESSPGVAVSQLLANVHHLRSQLFLAQAVLQAKDASIGFLQAEAESLKARLNFAQYVPENMSSPKQSSESEPVIWSLIAVKKFDWKFIQIDVPELTPEIKTSLLNSFRFATQHVSNASGVAKAPRNADPPMVDVFNNLLPSFSERNGS